MTKKEKYILIIAGILILFCYAIAGLYSHPSGDDFSYAVRGQKDNFLKAVLNERYRWSGRYISNFLVLFSPLNWGGLVGYKLMPTLLILLTVIGTSLAFKNVLSKNHFTLSLVSTLITFSIMPDITEGIYWYTGAWTYIPGGILLIVGLSFILKYWNRLTLKQYLISFPIFLIASGFNETVSLIGTTLFLLALLRSSNRKQSIVFLGLFLCFFVYILTAPGNEVRSSDLSEKNQLFYSLYMSITYSVRFIGEWLLNPAIYLWGIILLGFKFDSDKLEKLVFLQKPLNVFLMLTIPTFIACFGPIWSTGILGQYRTANLSSYIFIPTLTLIIIANKPYLNQKLRPVISLKYTFLMFVVCLTLWKNQFYLFKELISGEIIEFNQEMNKRYSIIENCNDIECYVPEIKQSKTLFVYPLRDNPNHWLNKSYQKYFKSGRINKITAPIK